MKQIEVGMYVRTKYGIRKIEKIAIINNHNFYQLDKDYISDEPEYHYEILDEDIIGEPSFNITDLIEVEDYIRIITSAYFEPVYYSYGKLVIRDDIDISKYTNKFIAEVITKEQFEQIAYKVGE